jgi:hypothetical protein
MGDGPDSDVFRSAPLALVAAEIEVRTLALRQALGLGMAARPLDVGADGGCQFDCLQVAAHGLAGRVRVRLTTPAPDAQFVEPGLPDVIGDLVAQFGRRRTDGDAASFPVT